MPEEHPQNDRTVPPGPANPALTSPAERTAPLRRSETRGLAGLLVLALVFVLEVVRRSGEGPPGQPATTSPAQKAPIPPTAATLAAAPRPAAALPASSSLAIDFQHGFRSGRLSVFVDDQKAFEQELSSRITSKVLGLERRRGRVRETLEVQPGRRRIRVEVAWPGKERSRTVVATFSEGKPRRLAVEIFGLTKSLSLEWE